MTSIEVIEFCYTLENAGMDPDGFDLVFDPESELERKSVGFRIYTDGEVRGEYVGGMEAGVKQLDLIADYLVGRNPLKREKHWSKMKRSLRKFDRMGIGPLDIALWDLAGKYYQAPINELLGTYRKKLPTYASTYHGDMNGGLDSPEAYADFAEECLDMGYPAFKVHGWTSDKWGSVDREIEMIHEVGDRVGDEMDLMYDPACELEKFSDALRVGRACDEEGFFWLEDPYRDGGISQYGHKKLRQLIDTPLLQTEHVRGLEAHTDFIANEATDYVRSDPDYDAGITGAMKIARVAEGFGIDVEFHAAGPAQRHCMAATRNSNYYEMALVHPKIKNLTPPVYESDYSDQLDSIDSEGYVNVPDGAGLGVEYDWGFIEENEVNRKEYS
ncbi:mandelate racemase [candidate division MSBL1 archaeon SCGC-AAA259A05]|uniref:Mandelate racemase n=1 Tax=candidate division MSBL1 archaeon SCGC-AAA259A05 TaxID=1698259 RepID=A0A133U3F5_9EURY|nr:mandelate racemase [candidate division MSBL1 archaeon SCGC-AAA259A05]